MRGEGAVILVHILNVLAPVFLLVLLGVWLCRRGLLSDQAFQELNRFVYWMALPAFLFKNIIEADLHLGDAGRLALVLLASAAGIIVLSSAAARALRLPRSAHGTFVQAAFRANLAYVGLPIVYNTFLADSPERAREMQTLAILGMGALIPFYNVAAVLALLRCGPGRAEKRCFRRAAGEIARNPLILSCLIGLAGLAAGLRLPAFAGRTLDALGAVALPVALLGVGASVARQSVRGRLPAALAIAGLRVVISPLLGLAFARWLGLGADETRIVLVLLTCPTAVVSHVLVQELGGDEALSSSAIVLSTLLSVPALSLVVALG